MVGGVHGKLREWYCNQKMKTMICPICLSSDLINNIEYENVQFPRSLIFEGLVAVGCKSCGFGYSSPDIPQNIVNQFYSFYYRQQNSPFFVDFSDLKRTRLEHRSLAQLLLAKNYVDFNCGETFLDIGPGSAASFNCALNTLKNPKLVAIEFNDGAKNAYKRLYNAETFSDVNDFIASGYSAKIVLLSHSLEHFRLPDLESALQNFGRLLSPGGIMIIEVPLTDMRIHANSGVCESPHFLFFSLDSIDLLFRKYNWDILYLNSCAETYGDWERSRFSNVTSAQNSMLLPLKILILKIKNSGRNLLSKMIYLFPILSSFGLNYLSSQFSYCGDRTCLRIVVQPTD